MTEPIWKSLSFSEECWDATCTDDSKAIADMGGDRFLSHFGPRSPDTRLTEIENIIASRTVKTSGDVPKLVILRRLRDLRQSGKCLGVSDTNLDTAKSRLRYDEVDGDEVKMAAYKNRTSDIIAAMFPISARASEVPVSKTSVGTVQSDDASESELADLPLWRMLVRNL